MLNIPHNLIRSSVEEEENGTNRENHKIVFDLVKEFIKNTHA